MNSFYVKHTDKLYGPINVEQFAKCLNKGIFTEKDLISEDRLSWISVNEFRDNKYSANTPVAPRVSPVSPVPSVSQVPKLVKQYDSQNSENSPDSDDNVYAYPNNNSFDRENIGLYNKLKNSMLLIKIFGLIAAGLWILSFFFGLMFRFTKLGGWLWCASICSVIFLVISIIFSIFGLIGIYRAWQTIPVQEARTTPGKAVGFLFIPFFNLYWMFVAFCGLAAEINQQSIEKTGRECVSQIMVTVCCIMLIVAGILQSIFFQNPLLREIFQLITYVMYGFLFFKLPSAAQSLFTETCSIDTQEYNRKRQRVSSENSILYNQLKSSITCNIIFGSITALLFVITLIILVLKEDVIQWYIVFGSCIAIFTIMLSIFVISGLVGIYRAWQTIPVQEARTTPGKAVGFLFIPFFNLYWQYVAFVGLAQDINKQSIEKSGKKYSSETLVLICYIFVLLGFGGITMPIIYFYLPNSALRLLED